MSACSRGRCRFGRAHGAEVGRWVSCRPLRIFETYFLNEAQTSNKKADISAGLVCWRIRKQRSVFRYNRRARDTPVEAVVDAQGDHIHVLPDPIVEKSGINRIDDRERVV